MEIFESVPASQAEYTFYEDDGHGWLAVPDADVESLGIAARISRYSYTALGVVYLEEDCDLATFLRAREAIGQPVRYAVCRVAGDAFVRNLPRYQAVN